ncbi:heme/copper-type cytochrome/quinol oxidase subunit 1 [Hydrogenivirga caldilitoris]|uniref:Heme/copper-type cytochrome/quinol oxidase subunit 1 n=1 Tax=Hydrogenivirga caldilitoris TaxID=246264 RepID=A0A497XNM3_9AQUI|nr:cytochrome C oxidase subunit I [Hydrogenivirga caldilitoris]RLJ70535.1 heme/copper-type cytochrome/quinol oxidase subunit 1 [Hydrogenivirga caldilitoris]
MRAWFLLFILSIGAGGFFALLVALARTPGIADFFPPQLFYHWLIGHVDLALIIGFLSFLVSLWYRTFGLRPLTYELALSYGGAFLVFMSALLGLGTPVHNNYIPTIDNLVFFLGVVFFGAAFFLSSLRFLKVAFPLLFKGELLEAAMAVSVLLSLLFPVSLVISFLKTPKLSETYLYFESLYWLPGHIHQFINATLLLSSWMVLLRVSGYEPPRWLRYILFLLLPFPVLYFLLQLFVDNPLSDTVRTITTSGYALGIGVPTLIFVASIFKSALSLKSFFGRVALLSMVMYVFGAFMGYLIAGSDLRIPAHYHGVIASILIALMGLTYHYIQELGYREGLPKLIRLQPYLYGIGMLFFTSGLFWAGVYGAPRKTFGTGYIESFKVYVFMLIMGLGSVLSVIGGILFVIFVLYSIIKRYELGSEEKTQP